MGFNGEMQTQGAYPAVSAQEWPQAGHTAGPQVGVPVSTAGIAGVTAPGGYPATPAAGPPEYSRTPKANKTMPATPPMDIAGAGASSPTAVAVNTSGRDTRVDDDPCSCSAGWVLFGIGFLFPVCWVVGAFLPFCTHKRSDRRAAILSSVMFIISLTIIIVAAVLTSQQHYYYSYQVCTYYNGHKSCN